MNAGGNYILASYISLCRPFVPHALRGAVTKLRFNYPISLILTGPLSQVPRFGVLDSSIARPSPESTERQSATVISKPL